MKFQKLSEKEGNWPLKFRSEKVLARVENLAISSNRSKNLKQKLPKEMEL